MDIDEIYDRDSSVDGWLYAGRRIPLLVGALPSSGEFVPPLTDADRARIVRILNQLPIVQDPTVHSIDG